MFAEDPLLVNCNIFGMVLSDNNWRGQSILVRSLLEEQRGIKFCKVYNTSGKGKKLQTIEVGKMPKYIFENIEKYKLWLDI